jgi:Bifunctional DNA primase/polymerase, N-terminal
MSIADSRAVRLAVPEVNGLSAREAAHIYLDAGFMPHPWRVKVVDGDRTKASAYFWFSFGNDEVYDPDSPSGAGHPRRGCVITHGLIQKWRPSWRCGLAVCSVSGLFAIDVDDIEAFEGWEPGWEWPVTARSATGRKGGGYHLLYDGRGLGEEEWPRQGNIVGGQIKSNGFIAVEPSLHPSGRKYHWVRDRKVADRKVARVLPGGLGRDLVRWRNRQNGHAGPRDRAKLVSDAGTALPGLQHDSLRDYASDLAQMGLIEEEAMVLLRHMSGKLKLEKHRGSWTDESLNVLFRSAQEKIVGNARGAEARELMELANFEPMRAESPEELAFWEARPVLAHIREAARASLVGPWAVLAECLAEVLCHTPPCLRLPPLVGHSPASLNMLIALVGDPGDGKGVVSDTAKAAFNWEGIIGLTEDETTRAPVGTGEGLNKIYGYNGKDDEKKSILCWRTMSAIITIREIDTYTSLAARTGSTISDQIRFLYDGDVLGFSYSSESKSVIIPRHEYRGVIMAGVQPGRGESILGDVEGGFAQRWLWLPTWDPGAPDDEPEFPGSWKWAPPDSIDGHVAYMGICEQIREDVRTNRKRKLTRQSRIEEAHSLLTREKVAAGLALLDMRDAIGEEDWELSGYVMRVSDTTRDYVAAHLRKKAHKENLARGRAEGVRRSAADATVDSRRKARVRRNIIEKLKGRDWTSSNWINRQIAGRDKDVLPELYSEMTKDKTLESRKYEYRGQTGLQFRLPARHA